MGNPRRTNGYRRNAVLRRVRGRGEPCWICGHALDPSLPPGLPESLECDELVPVSKGGSPYDPGNVAGAHRCCNSWRKARGVSYVRAIRAEVDSLGGSATPADFVAKAKYAERAAGAKRRPIGRQRTTTEW